MNLKKIFTQKGNIVTINYYDTKVTFSMPDYFNIKDVSDDLKILSLIFLFYPLDKSLEKLFDYKFTRKRSGDKIGLAYSGGIDSTAAYALLLKDKLVLFHHKRIINSATLYKHDNPLYVIDHLPHDVLMIESDLEDVRLKTGSYAGFINEYAFFGGFILLADYLNIGYITSGHNLEDIFMIKGYKYRDFYKSDFYKPWVDLLKRANLKLFLAVAPCSQYLNMKIVKENNLTAQACLRGTNGEGCNKCYKCFRKKMIDGEFLKDYKDSKEVMRMITSRPVRMAAGMIYGMNKHKFNVPELEEYKNMDLTFLEDYFEDTLNVIPEEYRDYLRNELNKYANLNSNINLLKNFSVHKEIFTQEGNIVTINYLDTKVTFAVPDYFNIDEVSEDLKQLSLILLFYPIDKTLINHKFTRESAGDKIGLAFSGGVDSVAASALLPKDKLVLFHHKRIINRPSLYKHDNPMFVIDHHPDDVLIIESNLEDVRLKTGKMTGFLNDFSFYAGFVLLADYLEIGYLSTGMMLESTYIKGGYEYRDFHNSDYFKRWFTFFKNANLPLFFPCIPCSEILNNKIVKDNNLTAQSCIRGVNGEGCGTCYKCFRKKMFNGEVIENYTTHYEINKLITSRPLKQGASLIYAMQKGNFDIPELVEYKNVDVSFLEDYFEYTLNSIPEEYRDYLRGELNKYANPNPDIDKLKNFKL